MMSKNSIVPFLKDYLIKFLTRPFLLDTNVIDCKMDRENTYIAFKLKSRNFYMRMQIVLV